MSEVLRSTTFQLAFNGNDGLTGIRTFTKAVTDADKTVEELNRRLGENATVTYNTVRSKKELTAEAIAATREIERTAKTVAALTRNYEHQTSLIGKTAQQQAALNAVYALGASATDEQKTKVMELATALQRIQEEEAEIARASAERIANDAKIDKQMQQATQRYQELSGELQRYISLIDKSADEQEIANNVAKLGANATDEQRNKVAQLTTNLVTLRNAQKAKGDAERIANAESEKTKVNLTRVTQQYQFLSSIVGKTADEVEQLKAANELGSNATEAQRQQVMKSVQEYQKLRGAVEGAQGSFRNARGVMQNFGWQMQDTLVQLQMGTSAFVVFSQQGSQMASAFGPKGAIIGMFITLAGVIGGGLWAAFNKTAGSMEKLDEITKRYNDTLKLSSSGVTELTDKIQRLGRYSKLAADIQLRIARADVFREQSESIKVANTELQNFSKWTLDVGKKASDLGLTNNEFVELQSSITALNKGVTDQRLQRYLDAISNINPTTKNAKEGAEQLTNTLLNQYDRLRSGMDLIRDTNKGWENLADEKKKSSDEIVKAFESESQALTKQTETTQEEYNRREQALKDYSTVENHDREKLAKAYADLNAWKKEQDEKVAKQREKVGKDATNKIIQAFNTEYLALTKQTESVIEEYDRRKKALDAYRGVEGYNQEKLKKSYEDLDQWKEQQLSKEFNTLAQSLSKRTNTIQEEYDRQKSILDTHVARKGEIDAEAAQAYIDLETWKTDKLRAEYDSRESIRRRIENAQIRSQRGDDPVGAEMALYATNQAALQRQRDEIGKEQVDELKRIDNLLIAEKTRHLKAMDDADRQQLSNQINTVNMAVTQMNSLVDIMSTGTERIKEQTKDMNGFQKAMFISMQAVSAAMAIINGMELGAILAKNAAFLDWTGMSSAAALTFGTSLGYAQAGAIMGVTIAGAFDKGGNIPAGQAGIVSEYGDELVNGVLVEGPARVTSREETARMMNQGSNVSLKISIENQIPGAVYEQQQLSADEVRIIARQEFNKNIDEGVSNVLASGNSKSSKSLRKNYNTKRNL